MASRTLGDEIRKGRKARALSLEELGSRVGLSTAFLSRVERGERVPRDEKVIKAIAKAIKREPVELLGLAAAQRSGVSWAPFMQLLRRQNEWADGGETKFYASIAQMAAAAGPTGALDKMMDRVRTEVVRLAKDGEFEITISGERAKTGKRRVLVKAGRVHRFRLSESDLAD